MALKYVKCIHALSVLKDSQNNLDHTDVVDSHLLAFLTIQYTAVWFHMPVFYCKRRVARTFRHFSWNQCLLRGLKSTPSPPNPLACRL